MTVKYRYFENIEDLDLQREFWLKVTSDLPWAWKPNNSQKWYANTKDFNPKSKFFAFENNELVGYMSCVNRGTFVPIGYPWVLPEYEGEVREHLFNTLYSFAIDELGGRSFLQRFREEWDTQNSFFEDKGFEMSRSYPIIFLILNHHPKQFQSHTTYPFQKNFPMMPL